VDDNLAVELELSIALVRAKDALNGLEKLIETEIPEYALIVSNAMRSVLYLEKCLQDYYVRPAIANDLLKDE
jgi:hypothetical protein